MGAASADTLLVSRRSFLAAAAGLGAVGIAGVSPLESWSLPLEQVAAPPIFERAIWVWDLPPKGDIPAEDVGFLLVHHTLRPANNYREDDVVGILPGIYHFHTGPDRGWPDIAYIQAMHLAPDRRITRSIRGTSRRTRRCR